MTDIKGTAALTPNPDDNDALREAEAARLKAVHDREFAEFTEGSYHSVEQILRRDAGTARQWRTHFTKPFCTGGSSGPSFATTSNRPAGSFVRRGSRS